MAKRDLTEHPLSSQQVYRGDLLDARRDEVRLPDGRIAIREYCIHPGAVMVVPMLDDGRLVLERQYRYPLRQTMVEFPAGKLDPGEAPLQCAMRELAEETGYRAREWARAGVMHPVIAYSTEFIEVWFARGLERGEPAWDEGEFLEVFSVSQPEIEEMARNGTLTDAKTLVGLLWLQNWRAGHWGLNWQSVPPSADCR